ncbi:asparagine synthase (glutamine-hydrolyzing) [Lachnospiraceae bacterium MD335]|nr:asparagine synthase (glutamine-hydrolyzing) [Lachnospiraceae bacterium MD335]
MCGIAGFCSFNVNFREESARWYGVLQKMNRKQKHRGPDNDGLFLERNCGLAHTRLSILDLSLGNQPMTRQLKNKRAAIVYNGEIYNMPALRKELEQEGIVLETSCDTEVILMGWLSHGTDYVKKLNGIFAFAIWDETDRKLYLYRDRLGVKPLFFTHFRNTFIFSSELKGILCFPDFKAQIDRDGLCEVFGLGPAKTYGNGVFKDIAELLPGHFLEYYGSDFNVYPYWKLESRPHSDTWVQTVERTRDLVTDAIRMQMLSDVPICTFLSGGVDSSLVTAVCAAELQKQGKRLDTYSFDFKDNDKNFRANAFQPSQDKPWVDKMIAHCRTNHQYLECSNAELFDYLFEAVDARDLPCMADVEASMLYFCKRVAKNHKVTLTGECADEIFGGYPWFHKKECFDADCFPWSMDFAPRTMLLKDSVCSLLPLEEYAHAAYRKTVSETPLLEGESDTERRRREISYLNLKWFMQTLLDRMDRTSMHTGLEARVPFADHRIVEYVWNVPWDMKCKDGIVKGLLRAAAEGLLPAEVLYRKKSPYPKTYDPAYENLLRTAIIEVLSDTRSPLRELISIDKTLEFIQHPSDYGRPFYGQLMAGPQLLAYLLQVNYWLKAYEVELLI